MSTSNTPEYLPSVESLTPTYSDSLPVPQDVRKPVEFAEFARWFALPSWEREPKTQKEFAATVGVSEDTLTDWKKRPEFWTLAGILMREWMRERTPDVVGSIYQRITSGDGGAGDAKFFLAIAKGDPNA